MGKKINNLLGKNINKHITEGKNKMGHVIFSDKTGNSPRQT